MPLTVQAILRAKARKTPASAATVDPGTVRGEDAAWRAAIMEFDGGLRRNDAERAAYDALLEAMGR